MQIGDNNPIKIPTNNFKKLESAGNSEIPGTVYKIPGKNTEAVVLNKPGLEKLLNIKLKDLFIKLKSDNLAYERGSYLIGLDVNQQKELLKIVNDALKKKGSKNKVEMLSLMEAKDMAKVLADKKFGKEYDLIWFWTGEKTKNEKENQFIFQRFDNGETGSGEPDDFSPTGRRSEGMSGVVIFKILKNKGENK